MDRVKLGTLFFYVKWSSTHWIILKAEDELSNLEYSKIAESLNRNKFAGLKDVVCGVNDISLMVDERFELRSIENATLLTNTLPSTLHLVEVDFKLGTDWDLIANHTKLVRDEFISKVCEVEYTFLMFGFLPGFIYLEGLKEALHIPRKSQVSKFVPEGSLAIGGSQIGVYTMPSLGGWNMIGKVITPLFDSSFNIMLNVGDRIKFSPIT